MTQSTDWNALLGKIVDPELNRPFSELKMVAGVEEQGDRLAVTIDLPTPAYPGRERIEAAVQTAVSEQEPGRAVDIEWISNVRGK